MRSPHGAIERKLDTTKTNSEWRKEKRWYHLTRRWWRIKSNTSAWPPTSSLLMFINFRTVYYLYLNSWYLFSFSLTNHEHEKINDTILCELITRITNNKKAQILLVFFFFYKTKEILNMERRHFKARNNLSQGKYSSIRVSYKHQLRKTN